MSGIPTRKEVIKYLDKYYPSSIWIFQNLWSQQESYNYYMIHNDEVMIKQILLDVGLKQKDIRKLFKKGIILFICC